MNFRNPDNDLYNAFSRFMKSGEKAESGRVLEQVKAKAKRPNQKEIEKEKAEYRLGMLKA